MDDRTKYVTNPSKVPEKYQKYLYPVVIEAGYESHLLTFNKIVNHHPDKSGRLLSTFPEGNGCHNAYGNRKGDIVVGSALRKSLFQGQPVNPKNNMNTNIDFAMQGG